MLVFITIVNIVIGLGLILLGCSPYFGNQSIDIQNHDTYYFVYKGQLLIDIGIYLLLKNFLVFLFRKKIALNKLFSLHLAIEVAIVFIAFYLMVQQEMSGVPRRYYSFESFSSFSTPQAINRTISVTFFLFFLNQFFFLVLLVANYFIKKKAVSLDDILDET